MKLFGITGGIGMGKSTSAGLLRSKGIPVADTDEIAREVVEPGQPALEEIRAAFDDSIIDETGKLRRNRLAEIVFSDPDARRKLEAILHPRIRQSWMMAVEQWKTEKRAIGVVVIPLLFETEAQEYFDAVVCVACSAASQKKRLSGRGWSKEEIERRCQSQWSVEKKMHLSHYVVWTEGLSETHTEQLNRIIR